MFTVIGLGNPGPVYAGTRHNAGFRVVEALSRRFSASKLFALRWSLCAVANFAGEKILLVQPLTFMNLSGKALAELLQRYSLDQERLLIIHDDMDLPLGKIRLRDKGSSAGHKGVQSIIDVLHSEKFMRLRFGIGPPPAGVEGAEYVLERFQREEKKLLDDTVAVAVQSVPVLLAEGPAAAMNRFN